MEDITPISGSITVIRMSPMTMESTATMAGSTTPMARERRSSSCSSHRREINN